MLPYLLRLLFLVVSSLVPSCLAIDANEPQPTGAVVSPVDRVLDCAANCTREFIQTDYPNNACSQGLDIECLCRTNTNSGYTLGEAALRCSLAYCPLEAVLRSTVYSICDSIAGALPRTHATITATIVTTPSPTSTTAAQTETAAPTGTLSSTLSTSSTISSEFSESSRSSESKTTHVSTTLTSFESPISITRTVQHPSSATTSDQASDTGAASKNSTLKPSAVIGVSVASGVSGFFIIGLIIFCCCRKARRRNQQAKDNNFFEIGGAMSEPPDFSLPPKRPTPGPSNPSSRTTNEDSRPARLMSPFEYRSENPAVVVTKPGDDHANRNSRRISPSKIGFAFSSNSENEALSSQSSQRTISDLLPEKPVYDLYPQPLRWSQQKTPRPASGATLFEEDVVRPRGGPGAPTPYMNSALLARYNSSRQHNRIPMAGLPDNPRAMMHGFEGRNNGSLTPRNPDPRKRPIYAHPGAGVHTPRHADIYDAPSYNAERDRSTHHDNYVDNYWQQPDLGYMGGAGMPSPRITARRSLRSPQPSNTAAGKSSGEFETININENTGSRRASRHSGTFRTLSPLKEVRTPTNIPPQRDYFRDDAPVNDPGRRPPSTAAGPASEVVSRPRVVRQDDIKRVQIRRGKPQPAGQAAPYGPEDYWDGYDRDLFPDLNPHALVSDSRYPVEMMGRMPKKRAVPTERNLTPSRHGTDLILRVD
ncbi:hypothetical protein P170DRAFT_349521 [Aspergillus steynii IBT 23096]|uniref:Extracellular membrane protein CFEM domain-containing protein n=1 Tax=Aspergillus steynii IBT 23096 TaxID=1392250 RepID=A0A2I2GJT7_9EURO|nr:uncharacterized protein P170DRAFT_349521 [Aspergillus steynii IBT 23096]PLB53148.1 hypothetical protein P170DRAFT_349521 [Aspergillus steynii IBT 23096]